MDAISLILKVALYYLCPFLLIVGVAALFRAIFRTKSDPSPKRRQFRKELALAIMCGVFLVFLVALVYGFACY